ncbi:hypothetical protein [Dactylosporangium sp. CA-233914]|uniref:hypothetical protein n=1 Tax=Dactylosporangium sp. CA-233914 TaxID=3239934 RepID=UPI003D8F1FBE
MSKKLIDGIWVGVVVVVMLCVFGYCSTRSDDGDSSVAVPAQDAQSVADDLARAAKAHEVCYGWQLLDSTTPVSSGSNLGPGVKVSDRADECPRYIEVRGTYHWYPDSSESEDYARYSIVSNVTGGRDIDPAGLDRLGAGPSRLLDDPAAAILDAAEALPLLAQEAGAVSGTVAEPSLSASPAPLSSGGSDFWRDRWVLVVISGSFLLAAVVTAVLGFAINRRQSENPE